MHNICVERITPTDGLWRVRMRVEYSWPDPGKSCMSLHGVGIAVALLTRCECHVAKLLMTTARDMSVEHERTWLGALHARKDDHNTTSLTLCISPTEQLADKHIQDSATDGWLIQSSINTHVNSWVRTQNNKRTHQAFVLSGTVVRAGYPLAVVPKRWPRTEKYVCCQRLTTDRRCTLIRVAEYIAMWDGKWLWFYHAQSSTLIPSRRWAAPLTSVCGRDCILSAKGMLRIGDTHTLYVPIINHMLRDWEGSSRIGCLVAQTAFPKTDVDGVLWMSTTGELWRTTIDNEGNRSRSSPIHVVGTPAGWGSRSLWCVPDDVWTSWSTALDSQTMQHQVQWVCICGASAHSGRSSNALSTFNLLVERLCLRTESFLHSQKNVLELVQPAKDLCAGPVTVDRAEFKGGVVCILNTRRETRAICVSRDCLEPWLASPASKPIYDACGTRCAYVDRGGHIVVLCLKTRSACSNRVANPTLHDVQILSCSILSRSVIISSHSNILSSIWRPDSLPACPLQTHDMRWSLIYPRVPYLTCCTWDGDILWCLELPTIARCLLNGSDSQLWVGTLRGIFQVDAQRGVILRCFPDFSAVELVGYHMSGDRWALAGRTDTHDHFIISR